MFRKGFTIVELLAVIIVLGLIMTIAVPAISSSLNSAKQKAFIDYIQKVYLESEKKIVEDTELTDIDLSYMKNADIAIVYDIKKDLGIDTGDYKGFVEYVFNDDFPDGVYAITLYNDEYFMTQMIGRARDGNECNLITEKYILTDDASKISIGGNSCERNKYLFTISEELYNELEVFDSPKDFLIETLKGPGCIKGHYYLIYGAGGEVLLDYQCPKKK